MLPVYYLQVRILFFFMENIRVASCKRANYNFYEFIYNFKNDF